MSARHFICEKVAATRFRIEAGNGAMNPEMALNARELERLLDQWRAGNREDPISQSFSLGTLRIIADGVEEMIETKAPRWSL